MNWALAIATIFATLFSPLLAVRVQKLIEKHSEKRNIKVNIFTELMATRSTAARLSNEHVRALNMIDLAFYGDIKRSISKRTKSEKKVLDAWKEYFTHLCTHCPENESGNTLWNQTSDRLFVNLLSVMAEDIGYDFDRVHLQNAIYIPVAHGQMNLDNQKIRKGLASIFSGETALKMDVISFPESSDDQKSQ
ncbi:DUF6680 family protein [Enterobacter oligotrophicus]|uniref:DUF6680 family protein n=1 Tax=Enterobacter oligotrophicus TaxID=2478464 RepID=UPI001260805A|nr:DUF6680 family protein [Enterobacter oligotrophicus]